MVSVLIALLHSLRRLVRSRASLHLEILALRHQLAVVNRTRRSRLRLTSTCCRSLKTDQEMAVLLAEN